MPGDQKEKMKTTKDISDIKEEEKSPMMGEQVEGESKMVKRFWFQKMYTNDFQI